MAVLVAVWMQLACTASAQRAPAAFGSALSARAAAQALPVLLSHGFAAAPSADRYEYAQVHMGLPVRVVLYAAGEAEARDAAAAAFARMAALDATMSDYRPDSELNRLSQTAGAGRSVETSPELFDVLSRAVELARLTGGAFDPTIGPLVSLWREARARGSLPDADRVDRARARVGWHRLHLDATRLAVRLETTGMRLDLGGIAKGWILQDAARVLREQGTSRFLVEAGGDIVVGDAPPGLAGWRIDAPGADPAFAARAASLTHAALSTSGPAAQHVVIDDVHYSHVVDPRTGIGLTHELTAYVIAPHGATADALATALTVAGRAEAPGLLRQFEGVSWSVQ